MRENLKKRIRHKTDPKWGCGAENPRKINSKTSPTQLEGSRSPRRAPQKRQKSARKEPPPPPWRVAARVLSTFQPFSILILAVVFKANLEIDVEKSLNFPMRDFTTTSEPMEIRTFQIRGSTTYRIIDSADRPNNRLLVHNLRKTNEIRTLQVSIVCFYN